MKRFILLFAVGCIGFTAARAQNINTTPAAASATPAPLAIGAAIPQAGLNMKGTDGGEMSLGKAKTDKGLVVMFSCNTCPYVIKSQERTREAIKFAAEKGVGMVILNSNTAKRDGDDSYEAMSKYAKEQGYSVSYLVDENNRLADEFGATRTPEVFLFDGKGKLVYKGAMEDNPADPASSTKMYLKDAIEKMVSGKKIDPNTTKSIGCSIKRG